MTQKDMIQIEVYKIFKKPLRSSVRIDPSMFGIIADLAPGSGTEPFNPAAISRNLD